MKHQLVHHTWPGLLTIFAKQVAMVWSCAAKSKQ